MITSKQTLWYELNRALAVIRSPQSFEIEGICSDIEKALHPTGGFICSDWKFVDEKKDGKQLVARCDKEDGHIGDHLDSVILINWENTFETTIRRALPGLSDELVAHAVKHRHSVEHIRTAGTMY